MDLRKRTVLAIVQVIDDLVRTGILPQDEAKVFINMLRLREEHVLGYMLDKLECVVMAAVHDGRVGAHTMSDMFKAKALAEACDGG